MYVHMSKNNEIIRNIYLFIYLVVNIVSNYGIYFLTLQYIEITIYHTIVLCYHHEFHDDNIILW